MVLGMPSVIKCINDAFIIEENDPEVVHFHPTKILKPLFPGNGYNKSKDQIEKICSCITLDDLNELSTSKKCKSFKIFYEKLKADLASD
jgi:hypothetical protein